MTIAPHQACYFAHELTRLEAVGELDRLCTTLFDSKVDLNPHQTDAGLFAMSIPLQKGVILADARHEDDEYRDSLFHCINRDDSPVNLLVGSREFTEGWNSWRVSADGQVRAHRVSGKDSAVQTARRTPHS